jgi:hypothetical protein
MSYKRHVLSRNAIPCEQVRKVGVLTLCEIVVEVVWGVMDRDRGGVRRWSTGLGRGPGKCEALRGGTRIDPYGSAGSSPGSTAAAFSGKLPVRAVHFVAFVEQSVGCAGV